jgi:uncharacterized protein (DUF3084 family)
MMQSYRDNARRSISILRGQTLGSATTKSTDARAAGRTQQSPTPHFEP